ncbi:probable transcription factor At4g00390 [Musa acuminata AAA Group]|uniref:probable transcription factor At4g00390 n=1 Tax=Musa acuminata AAA Group TaxID=214697 RepID=UPI0031DE0422
MRSKRLASHSANKASSSSSSSHSSAAAADSRLPTTEDPPSTNGGPGGRSAPQTPPASKPLPEPHAAASPAATSRRSERKRKPREFGGKSSPEIRQKKVWSEHDEVELLKGALAFRSRTDALPKQPTMAAFFASIKSSVGPHLTTDQVGYKLKRFDP